MAFDEVEKSILDIICSCAAEITDDYDRNAKHLNYYDDGFLFHFNPLSKRF